MKVALFLAFSIFQAVTLAGAEKPKPKPSKPDAPAGKEMKLTPLTENQQRALLERRLSGQMLGLFNGYASLLFAVDNIVVHSDIKDIGTTELSSPFPEFYKPTVAELFDSLARQTASSWSYDAKRAYWLFAKPAMPMPFKVQLAKGWESDERGNYLFCKPPGAPVGMDIYVMAEYSGAEDDPKLPEKMREAAALLFARNFKEDVTAKDMSIVRVGEYDSLHFKVPTPRPGTTWRQWAIAEEGQVILIVSAIDNANEKEVLPGVEAAIKTFEMKKKEPKKPAADAKK